MSVWSGVGGPLLKVNDTGERCVKWKREGWMLLWMFVGNHLYKEKIIMDLGERE